MKSLPLSYIEISKKNLIHNIKQFRKHVHKKTRIAAVVKGNAYGHGDREVVKILNPYVDYFQINSIEELEVVRSVTKKPVLLLGYVGPNDISRAITLGCVVSVFDLEHAFLINKAAKKLGKKQKVHIAVDALLGREGILPDFAKAFVAELYQLNHLVVDGVYAHFANIEDTTDFSHAERQLQLFDLVLNIFYLNGYPNIHTHISATSGLLAYEKDNGFNTIVRVGLGLYGMWPSDELRVLWSHTLKLRPVIRYVTHIAQIKVLPKGHTVGYGLTYLTLKPTTIAVIPQGYSNGVNRRVSNNGLVLIRGVRAPILGRIAMNMFVVDVSDIPNVQTGDEVIILGIQKKESISAEEIAQKTGQINYEVTTCLSPLLPRVILD